MISFTINEQLAFLKGFPVIYTLENRIKLGEILACYLEESKLMQKLMLAAQKFCKQVQNSREEGLLTNPFKLIIPIDLLSLHNQSEFLYDMFILEPNVALDILSEIIVSASRQFQGTQFIKVEDVYVTVLLTSVPPLIGINQRLKRIEGVLAAQTFPIQYVRSSVWRCKDVTCPGAVGQRIANATLDVCSCCGSAVWEDLRGRDLCEISQCKLLSVAALQGCHGTYTPTLVHIKEEIIKQEILELGLEYEMIGVESEGGLEVWGIQRRRLAQEALINSPFHISLPPAINALYVENREQYETSPWTWTTTLASQLCTLTMPQSACLHLKFGLLLSLASLKCGNKPVGVIAVGTDTCIAHKLMTEASLLAERRVATMGASLEGSVKTEVNSNLVWEEAGELTLATHGVCLLGDWVKHQQRTHTSAAVTCMESGFVGTRRIPLRACVWTYWGNISSRPRDQLQLRTLIDVFGMPFLSDEMDLNEYEYIVMQKLSEPEECEDMKKRCIKKTTSYEGLRQLLQIVTEQPVRLTESASDLIKRYFVASRRDRPECLPVSAITTISSLAEAHARLALRPEVVTADVVLIVYLYQEAITTLFGSNHISDYNKLARQQDEPIADFMDRQLANFTGWLDNYVLPV